MVQVRRWIPIAAVICTAALISTAAEAQRAAPKAAKKKPAPQAKAAEPPKLACGDYMAFQVLLDKQGFSPGEIDGKPGPNFSHAIAALQTARKLPATGQADCETWQALGGDTAGSPTAGYTITDADLKGPFVEAIPRELPDQASLPALGYTSAIEALAEKFHTSPAVLKAAEPRRQLRPQLGDSGACGHAVRRRRRETGSRSGDGRHHGDDHARRIGAARHAAGRDARLLCAGYNRQRTRSAACGDWKVTAVSWKPTFHYNPDLFWDAKASDNKATLKPGPNNPVGIAWIDVNIEHYGIHGTPEPSRVGHTESHGCVRLTNWDAARLAALVKPGTPVQFR